MCLDEITSVLRSLETIRFNHDRLQTHHPARHEKFATCGEEGVVVAPVDSLDHFDRDQAVPGTREVSVVIVQNRDLTLKTCCSDTILRIDVLLSRDRGRRDLRAKARCCMNSKTTPSGADLEHSIARPYVDHLTESIEFRYRTLFKREARGREKSR